MCITMLRIYYSNFALNTWMYESLFYTIPYARPRSQPYQSIRASDYPRDTSRIIFSPSIQYHGIAARLMTENVRVLPVTRGA